jgi:hypothetical protein
MFPMLKTENSNSCKSGMRHIPGLAFWVLVLSLRAYGINPAVRLDSSVTLIPPNAQTALISDIIIQPTHYPAILTAPGQKLILRFSGAYISEVSTIQISTVFRVLSSFSGYGEINQDSSYWTVVKPDSIEIGKTSPLIPLELYYGNIFTIRGIRLIVVPSELGGPEQPIIAALIETSGGKEYEVSRTIVGTVADPIRLSVNRGPSYIQSNNRKQRDGIVILRISENDGFENGFETQSIGSTKDATQLILTIKNLPSNVEIKDLSISGETTASVKAALDQIAMPLRGPNIQIPVYVLNQSAKTLENIDLKLVFQAGTTSIPVQSVLATISLGPESPVDIGIPFDPIPGAEIGGNRYSNSPLPPVKILDVIPWPTTSLDSFLNASGAETFATPGMSSSIKTGYAAVDLISGTSPYGIAVFSLIQNGATVSETAVLSSPPTSRARIFIDYRRGVRGIPSSHAAGLVDINTGIAVVNHGADTANVTYTLSDTAGVPITSGNGTISAGKHLSFFIDQLREKAGVPGFTFPPDFQSATQFGVLEISSSQPLSLLAVRGTMNQRNEFLMTTMPIADMAQPSGTSPLYFPQFADGGGYTTSIILLNASDKPESGDLEIRDENGAPFIVGQNGGTVNYMFRYYILPGGAFYFQTDGSPTGIKAGWLKVSPETGTPVPIGIGVFGYNPDDVLVAEAGIPSAVSTTHARIYVDLTENHNTGLAIANLDEVDAEVAVNAYECDGITSAGIPRDSLALHPKGHAAAFADQLIAGLPAGFSGVLDIKSTTPFAALTVRSLMNERNDFLMTTFPIADASQPAPSPIVFPQVADGGGYSTEFIFINPTREAHTVLNFYSEDGTPWDMNE